MRFCFLLAVSVAVVECALAFAPSSAISNSAPTFHPDAQMSNFYHAWWAPQLQQHLIDLIWLPGLRSALLKISTRGTASAFFGGGGSLGMPPLLTSLQMGHPRR